MTQHNLVETWLARLNSIGVEVVIRNGRIGLRPKKKIPADWLEELQRIKDELIDYFSKASSPCNEPPEPPPSTRFYRRAIAPSKSKVLAAIPVAAPASLDDAEVKQAAAILDYLPVEVFRLPADALKAIGLRTDASTVWLFREGPWSDLIADRPILEDRPGEAPPPPDLPPGRLTLKLTGGCTDFCRLRLLEIRQVKGPIRKREADYRCERCGRRYQLIFELRNWYHPTAEGAILPTTPCLPGRGPIPGWPTDVPAPAWAEDLLRDFADVVLRAGRQVEHHPGTDCNFPVAVLWTPADARTQWSCIKCGRRALKVQDDARLVDGFDNAIEGEAPPEQEPKLPASPPVPEPIPQEELALIEALAQWGKEHGWPQIQIAQGITLLAGEHHWQCFLGYLSTRQVTPAADRSRQKSCFNWERSFLGKTKRPKLSLIQQQGDKLLRQLGPLNAIRRSAAGNHPRKRDWP
ncbi:MAG: hypothetical protein NZ899_15045 [Thermoguttaceae bacterium]|nr:hypothetical protein [Thermoguttaceae bacterium]